MSPSGQMATTFYVSDDGTRWTLLTHPIATGPPARIHLQANYPPDPLIELRPLGQVAPLIAWLYHWAKKQGLGAAQRWLADGLGLHSPDAISHYIHGDRYEPALGPQGYTWLAAAVHAAGSRGELLAAPERRTA